MLSILFLFREKQRRKEGGDRWLSPSLSFVKTRKKLIASPSSIRVPPFLFHSFWENGVGGPSLLLPWRLTDVSNNSSSSSFFQPCLFFTAAFFWLFPPFCSWFWRKREIVLCFSPASHEIKYTKFSQFMNCVVPPPYPSLSVNFSPLGNRNSPTPVFFFRLISLPTSSQQGICLFFAFSPPLLLLHQHPFPSPL